MCWDFLQQVKLKQCFFYALQIRYTGFRDRPQEERMLRFQSACRTEGRTEIAFVASGTNLQLTFNCNMMPYGHERECDFEKEQGKVSTNIKQFDFNSHCFFHEASHYVFVCDENSDELRMISICTSMNRFGGTTATGSEK